MRSVVAMIAAGNFLVIEQRLLIELNTRFDDLRRRSSVNGLEASTEVRDFLKTKLGSDFRHVLAGSFRESSITRLEPALPNPTHWGSLRLGEQPIKRSKRNGGVFCYRLGRQFFVTQVCVM